MQNIVLGKEWVYLILDDSDYTAVYFCWAIHFVRVWDECTGLMSRYMLKESSK